MASGSGRQNDALFGTKHVFFYFMVAHLGLRTHELLYEEIGNIIAEFYQPETNQNVTKE